MARERNDHDTLFRHVFNQPEHLAGELRAALPKALVERMDLSTLRELPGTLVEPDEREVYTDLLFEVQIDRSPAHVLVLCEHQSSSDGSMPLRLLQYVAGIWGRVARNTGAKDLPPVVPLVVHHSERGWTAPRALRELVAVPPGLEEVFAPWIPDFTFVLDDISHVDGEQLRARAMSALGRLTLLCLQRMKHSPDAVAELESWVDVVGAVLEADHGLEALATALRYIMRVNEPLEPLELQRFLATRLGPPGKEAYVTAAEKLTREARAEERAKSLSEGLVKGRAEGRAGTLLRQLATRFGEVPQVVQARVRAGSEAELDTWIDRVLTEGTLEGVLGKPVDEDT